MPSRTRAGENQTAIVDDGARRSRCDVKNTRGRFTGISAKKRAGSLGVVAGEKSRSINALNAGITVSTVSLQYTNSGACFTHQGSARRDGQCDRVFERVHAEVLLTVVLGQLHRDAGIWI